MGIDGIGKGRGASPSVEPGGPGKIGGAGDAPFRVERSAAGGAEATTSPTTAHSVSEASPALSRLRSGDVDVNGYMDLRVEEATRGLEGLSPAQLTEIKRVLRDQMATDPGLAELVTRATGQTPSPPRDEE